MFWVMGIFKKVKLLGTLKNIGLGITDAIGITSVLRANVDHNHTKDQNGKPTGSGKLNLTRLVVAISVILSIFAYAKGWLTEDNMKQIFKLLF